MVRMEKSWPERATSNFWAAHLTWCFFPIIFYISLYRYTPGSTNIAGWKMDPDWVDVFPIENGDIPVSYVSLPAGIP